MEAKRTAKNTSFAVRAVCVLLVLLLLASAAGEAMADGGKWVNAWSTSPVSASLHDVGIADRLGVTLAAVSSRVTVTTAATGDKIRLTFSNEFGVTPLLISGCTVGYTGKDARTVQCGSMKKVCFGGRTFKLIPPGQTLCSDPVSISVRAGQRLTVTTYFGGLNTQRTIGLIGGETFAAVGNYTCLSTMSLGLPLSVTAASGAYEVIPSLKGIDVYSGDESACACVIFGDSTVANEIPRLLENKLLENGITNVSVTQQAIKGNRLLAAGVGIAAKVLGEAGLDRFERDVLDQAGVKYVVMKLGVNDIVHPYCKSKADEMSPVTFEEMTAGYVQLINAAHERGIKVYMTELTPWKGYTRNILGMGDDVNWTPEIDALRLALNEWFAGDDCPADGYIAFPGLTDPTDEYAMRPEYTTDGAHFTLAGQKALVEEFPLDIFS